MLARRKAPFRSTTARALAIAFIALLALTGTSCSKKTAPEITVPAGFTAVRDAKAGFAIGVPADWVLIPLPQDLDVFDKNARDLTANNDNLNDAVIQARQLLQFGGKMMAVTKDGASIVNLTVDKTKEKSLEQIATDTVPKLQENGATDVNQTQTTIGGVPALKLTFKYPLPKGDSTVTANEAQYYVLHAKKSWVVTVINGASDLGDTIAGTLKLR